MPPRRRKPTSSAPTSDDDQPTLDAMMDQAITTTRASRLKRSRHTKSGDDENEQAEDVLNSTSTTAHADDNADHVGKVSKVKSESTSDDGDADATDAVDATSSSHDIEYYTNDTIYPTITKAEPHSVLLVLGDQLFNPDLLESKVFSHNLQQIKQSLPVYMAESDDFCRHFDYHQIKLVLFLSAMRHYAEELRQRDWTVHYNELPSEPKVKDDTYLNKLMNYCQTHKVFNVYHYPISDQFFDTELHEWAKRHGVQLHELAITGFVTTEQQFTDYLSSYNNKPFMKQFYQQQRHRLNILITKQGKPEGGKYSFDTDNRKPLPKNVTIPSAHAAGNIEMDGERHNTYSRDKIDEAVIELISHRFDQHPGKAEDIWVPTTRAHARLWMQRFLQERLHLFGDYEDAITNRSALVFHSILTPYLNTGLLTAHEIVHATLKQVDKLKKQKDAEKVSLSSLEGFIRQVCGWREFIKGLDHHYGQLMQRSNFWRHHRQFKNNAFYDGTTGIRAVDDAIKKAVKLGYLHHIERLMIMGNIYMLCEIEPSVVYKWYMELFIDSADWVMTPNVYGMILNADGGIAFTKPYVCSSSYVCKQSGGEYKKSEPWCDILDGLYWRFLDKHKDFLRRNMRMGLILKGIDRMDSERKERIFKAAEDFLEEFTVLPEQYRNLKPDDHYQHPDMTQSLLGGGSSAQSASPKVKRERVKQEPHT